MASGDEPETMKGETVEATVVEETSESDPKSLENAIKISRQFMILLEDYRYLLSCYQETCTCHMNFDNQIFYRKMEERYNTLANISAGNSFLSTALEDSGDLDSLDELLLDSKNDFNANEKPDNVFIRRIKISDKQSTNAANSNSSVIISSQPNPDDSSDHEMTDANAEISEIKNEKLAFRCTHAKCDFITFNQADIVKHFSNHSSIETSQKFDKTEVLYVCDQCSKEFSGQKWLDNHIENVHAYAKIYTCDFPGCTYKSKFRCVMDDHRKRHGRNKEFKCTWPNCTSEFVTKRDMLAHVNFYHKGIKNYTCNWKNCNASFKDSNRLRHHHFTHTGERPYHCEFAGCGASFKQMPHLHKHRKTHNWNNEPRGRAATKHHEYECPFQNCNATFANDFDLNNHVAQSHDSSQVV